MDNSGVILSPRVHKNSSALVHVIPRRPSSSSLASPTSPSFAVSPLLNSTTCKYPFSLSLTFSALLPFLPFLPTPPHSSLPFNPVTSQHFLSLSVTFPPLLISLLVALYLHDASLQSFLNSKLQLHNTLAS